jgi:hypothetical protein
MGALPAGLAQQEDENEWMEASCPRLVSARLANPGVVGAPRLHPRYFPRSQRMRLSQALPSEKEEFSNPYE